MVRFFLSVIFICLVSVSFSQSQTLFGEWKSYLPFNKSFKLTETKNKIFCSSELTIYSVDKEDLSITLYDKTNDLNDLEVVYHEYDKYNDQLIIAYKNGNIDILKDDETVRISDIRDNGNIPGNKFLNDIFVADQTYAYFASDFGVIQFNLKEHEFGFTCFTDFPVNTIISSEKKLYLGSDNGIYSFDLNSNGNPNDFLQWIKLSSVSCDEFADHKGIPVFYSGRDIYKIINNLPEKVYSVQDDRFEVRFINTSEDLIMIGAFDDSRYLSRVFITNLKDYEYELSGCAFNIRDAIRDSQGKMWFADNDRNISWAQGIDQECNKISINSPYSPDCSDIVSSGENIFVASGGSNKINYGYASNHNGYYISNEGVWKNYNRNNTDFIKNNNLENFLNILSAKDLKTVYISAYGNGLIEMNTENNSFIFYNHTNSKLGETQGDSPGRVRITDMQFDDRGNLWMTLFGAERPLVVKTADGKWYSFKMQDGSTILAELDIDNDGQIWIKVISKGIIVFDNNGTIEDPTDDKFITLNNQNTNLPSNNINFINTDLDGNVWIGTDKGPLVFECSSEVISGDCSGTKKKTVLEGIADYVLNEVNINCIEFDGANRKWIGTTSGLYVLNPEGDEEIKRFTTENSPLFDNNITALAFNGESGEMIIGTLKGMLSYKTETIAGTSKNSAKAYAYPNPVPHDYDGLVAFRGLARDANVKITDIEGNLMYETNAQGGQATWDGKDFRGNRVGSGVYLVFSTATESLDNIDSVALKLFFIK
ncbi:MAG: hypothetical protein IPH57_04955 [Saprospiraceae bacterium]|nr:hypothetical protein [Saprospiraceae bacterium]